MRLFPMNVGQTRMRLVQAGAALTAAVLIAGCGNAYRSVVTPIVSSGPAAQPSSYAVVVSAPSTTTPGVATIIDYSGDTVMATANIGPGPVSFSMDETGSTGYTVNTDGTMTNFPVSTTLQTKNVTYSTLSPTSAADPLGLSLFTPASGLWAADLSNPLAPVVDVFSGSPQVLKLSIPVAKTPVMVIGSGSVGQRNYAISQNLATSTGVECNNSSAYPAATGYATPLETSSNTADTALPVGICPVYALPSSDGKRLFVLNRGDDTISVINITNNTLDSCTPYTNLSGAYITCHQTIPLSTSAVTKTGITPPNGTSGMKSTAGPIYAEFNTATNMLVVADYDAGTISIIDVTLDEYGNDYNTYSNPSCTVGGVTSYANCGAVTGGFGTVYTVAVGNNPAAVTVLNDGSRAYTANQTDQTVSIVNLTSHTVEKTLTVTGHPRDIASTQNSEYGKVYVSSPDSNLLTILTTTTDLVDTTVPVEGNILDVRVTTQNGSSGNYNNVSRKPGYGQPCYLPGNPSTLAACTLFP